MTSRYKGIGSIVSIGVILIVIGAKGLFQQRRMHNNEKQAPTVSLKMNKTDEYMEAYKQDHPIIVFANQVVENYKIEGVATIPIDTFIIDKDAHGRYLAQVEAVGIDKQNNTSIYTYYIIVEQQEQLTVMPCGIEVFKEELDVVKRNLIVSMMKVLNNWGDSL